MSMDELLCFTSYQDADTYILNYEKRTRTKYVVCKVFNSPYTNGLKEKAYNGPLRSRIYFDECKGIMMELPFDGVPFIHLGKETRECHYGPLRKKISKKKEKPQKKQSPEKEVTTATKTISSQAKVSTATHQNISPAPVVRTKTLTFKASSNESISLAQGLIQHIIEDDSLPAHTVDCLQTVTSFLDCSEKQMQSLRCKLQLVAPHLAMQAREKVIPRSETGLYSIEIEDRETEEEDDLFSPTAAKKSVPQVIVSTKDSATLEENGKSRDNDSDSDDEDDEEQRLYKEMKRILNQSVSKKTNCTAQIKVKAIIRFPRFKMTGPDSRRNRADAVNRLREAFDLGTITDEDKEYRCYVSFKGEHSCQSNEEESANTIEVDPLISKKIREIVREYGLISSCEVNEHLDRYRATLHDLPPGSRFYPSLQIIKNHMQLAVSSVISKQLISKPKRKRLKKDITTAKGNS